VSITVLMMTVMTRQVKIIWHWDIFFCSSAWTHCQRHICI